MSCDKRQRPRARSLAARSSAALKGTDGGAAKGTVTARAKLPEPPLPSRLPLPPQLPPPPLPLLPLRVPVQVPLPPLLPPARAAALGAPASATPLALPPSAAVRTAPAEAAKTLDLLAFSLIVTLS